MIDAVNNISANAASTQKSAAQASRSQPAADVLTKKQPAPQAPSTAASAHIRIDNQLDMAIIEYRSSDTGDVVRQYPTEAQIQAFSRAAETEPQETVQPQQSAEASSGAEQAAAPEVKAADVPEPAATAADAAPASSVNVTSDGSSVPAYSSSTQVVTA